jgi:hypothetical protein
MIRLDPMDTIIANGAAHLREPLTAVMRAW